MEKTGVQTDESGCLYLISSDLLIFLSNYALKDLVQIYFDDIIIVENGAVENITVENRAVENEFL